MEKINIAKLLKNCPTGMELDCMMFEDMYFDHISDCREFIYCYINYEDHKTSISFNKYGAYCNLDKSKCVLFPKGKNTWKGFHRPFVEGDVVSTESGMYIGIVKSTKDNYECCTFCSVHGKQDFHVGRKLFFSRLATKEEKQIMFNLIKANGYHWNSETKTLEKLINPIFKKGDKVRVKKGVSESRIIDGVFDTFYSLVPIGKIDFTDQDNWELVPNKFDINTLKPFESKVIVRTENSDIWEGDIFVRYDRNATVNKFHCIGGWYEKCIPFKGNEWLLGTTDDCNNYYKTWEK